MLTPDKKEKISYSVIKTIHSKFGDFPENASNNRNAPFHTAFLNAFTDKFAGQVSNIPFFISLSSWFHGLNTTLGQSFFEKVSHILCDGTKKEFKGLKISQTQQTTVTDIVTDLKNNAHPPNLVRENGLIYQDNAHQDKDVSNFTADCFFEDNDKIVAIELKTVKPNSGVFKNEKDKILSAKAGLKNAYPAKNIFFYLGFPFDPLSAVPTGSDKGAFMNYSVDFNKFFDPDEVLLADGLWNFLSSDDNTMQQLIDIINAIATTHFETKYEFLNNAQNRTTNTEEYISRLIEWNLYSEVRLVRNETALLKNIEENSRMMRKFNQPLFKDGDYNIDRFVALEHFLP